MRNLIIKLRKAEKLTQEALAKKLGMSRPTLIAIEKGNREITISELQKISDIFDVPMQIMLDKELSLEEKVDATDFTTRSLKKFHNLVLECIKFGSDKDGKITKTKLAKLVYLSDFAHYHKYLVPISGFEYRKLEQGPVAIEFFDIIDNDESIEVEHKNSAIMISLLEEPEKSILKPSEKEIIKAVCKKWKGVSTSEIVKFTHSQVPWSVCKMREIVPYTLINMEEPENVY